MGPPFCSSSGEISLRQPREPLVHRGDVFRVGGAKHERVVLEEPGRIAAELPLRADVGAGAQDDVEAFLLRFANVFGDIVLAGEVVDAWPRLVEVPEDIGGDGVQAHGAGLAEAVAPVGAGHARIVHLAGEDLVGMAVELKLAVGDSKCVLTGGRLGGSKQNAANESGHEQSDPHARNR